MTKTEYENATHLSYCVYHILKEHQFSKEIMGLTEYKNELEALQDFKKRKAHPTEFIDTIVLDYWNYTNETPQRKTLRTFYNV
mgnify:CR=1 FL=1